MSFMPEIKLRNVTKRWGKFYAVDNLNLDIEDNAFVTLLGPSGCGKTTTLRMIAGLETPTSGQITIGDRVVFDSDAGINVPANKRKVGFLFQNYALWPNMTVYQNISFGLSNIKEELPVYDFEAKTAAELIHALKHYRKIVEITKECVDKKGKLDTTKAKLKFIDNYTLSMDTAKRLLGFGLHEAADPKVEAERRTRELQEKISAIQNSYRQKGKELNEDFAVVKNGKVELSERKLCKEEVDQAVRRVARIVKIGMFMDRYPAELSGGQQQRVAIARTLAPEPEVLFMDEPLSNLDAKLRNQMRAEIIKLRQKINTTFLYVTHDQTEAMTLGDRIVIMKDGFIQQIGTPQEVFDHPANLFVAGFIGTPQMNFFDAKLKKEGEKYLVSVGGYQVELSPAKCANLVKQGVTDQDITLGVRPNHIGLRQEGSSIPAKVDVFEMMGNEIHLHVTAEGKDVVIIVPTMDLTGNYTEAFSAGKDLAFSFGGNACHVFDKEGKNLEF